MLNIEIQTEVVAKRLDAMTEHVKAFGMEDMPQGLTDWQTEDMHRHYPETEPAHDAEDEYSAATTIYPRSRTYAQTHQHVAHRPYAPRAKVALSSMPRLIKSMLKHPILRPELFDMLYSRMVALLGEKIKWR